MQATINIDDKLFEQAAKFAATENKSQLIEIALRASLKIPHITAIFGEKQRR